jgi:hypothetical protein
MEMCRRLPMIAWFDIIFNVWVFVWWEVRFGRAVFENI